MKESTNSMPVEPANTRSRDSYERSIGSDESVCEVVVSAVMAAENADMDDLEPLYFAVDGDALERITSSDAVSSVTFAYLGYRVEVTGDSRVILTPGM
ncbi:HalOD1 output domain-containing protein (plasmid) [Haladaptatus sp. SPP-AMP-3]|uniref:HalOD1 output domain-containing protein n=1 Tax=Haladaptatus sp. SPP-AMP-3 TaxID=3121295 RepID=UPI003C2F3F5D